VSRTRRTIELLAAVRPQELDAADEERSRRDFATILATPRDVPGPGTDRRVVPRRAPTRLGRAGLATAAVVAAAVLVPDRRPDGQPSQSANPAASQDVGTRGSVFLLASAKRVRTAAPAAEGAYWYARVRNLVVTTADAFSRQPRGLRFQIRIESTTGSWTPKHRGTTHVVEPTSTTSRSRSPPPRTAGPGESPGPSGSTTRPPGSAGSRTCQAPGWRSRSPGRRR
jgi:hypothetical protein